MSSQVSSTRKLVSASALMASGTMVSRILGLVRVMLIAVIFANGTRQADMFTLAMSVPNSLYILFAGGALNTVLVPQIVRHIKHDDDGGEAYTNRIMTAFMLIVAAVATIITLAAPVVASIYTSSEWRAPELADQYASLVALTYLTLPQIFFYGAFFLLGQVLNARDRFGPMMWAPIANNVISIAVLSIYFFVWGNDGDRGAAFTTPQILLLGIGSTAGIIAQTAVLIPYIRKVGFKLRPRFDLKGTGLGKTFSLTKWTIGFVAVNQLALVVVNRLATSATATGDGGAGVNVYSTAHLIWILPHSLITVSLATAMLPNASRLAAAHNLRGVAREALNTMRLALILLVPAAVGFFAMAPHIATLLFGHGLGADDAVLVGWALMAFAIGLIPFTIQFVCLRTFYAMEDTRTPFVIQVGIAGANAGLAILLVWLVDSSSLVAAALALAYSLAYIGGVLGSWQLLRRKLPALAGREIGLHLVRLLLGTIPGGVLGWLLSDWIADAMGGGTFAELAAVLAGLAVMAVVYLLVAKLLKVRELRSLTQFLRNRGKVAQPSVNEAVDQTGEIPMVEPVFVEKAASRRRPRQDFTSLTEDLMPTQLTPVVSDDGPPAEESLHEADFADDEASTAAGMWENEPMDLAAPLGAPAPEVTPGAVPGHAVDVPPAVPLGGPDHTAGLGAAEEPDEASIETSIHPAVPQRAAEPTTIVQPGALLSMRFRVEELLTTREGIESWRAHDLVLARDVLAHIIATDNPRLSALVDAARKGAVATDSRFLRVLDAVEGGQLDTDIGGFIVCEFADGVNLSRLLQQGPVSALEAAWIVRELADAMTAMHTQGLFHEQITPENVVITNTGAVRLVGFGLESAITESEHETWSEKERADVQGLARILYASLVTHWPGGDAYGMPAAPIIAGEVAPPHNVRGGVSPALDRICSATLTQRGAASQSRITTAGQLTTMLTEVLGTADASLDLEHRVRQLPDDEVDTAAEPTPVVDPAAAATAYAVSGRATPPPVEQAAQPSALDRDLALADEEVEDALHAMAPDRDPASGSRLLLWVLIGIAVLALIVALSILFGSGRGDEPGAGPEPTTQQTTADGQPQPTGDGGGDGGQAPVPGEAYPILRGIDFDPSADGGNDEENPGQLELAFDGDPATGWSTLRYHNHAEFGRLKPGVGIIVDLGEPRPIGNVELLFEIGGADVELRAPADRNAIEPPMNSQSQWDVLASSEGAAAEVTLTRSQEETTQYLMVYITRLPASPGEADRFITQVNEITVLPPSGE